MNGESFRDVDVEILSCAPYLLHLRFEEKPTYFVREEGLFVDFVGSISLCYMDGGRL